MTTNTPELKQIKGMVEDMEVIEILLGNKGRFVGDMVHISIKDLAGCIQAGETTWQPIETAPRDGTWIFLFIPGHGPCRAVWGKRRTGDEYGWVSHDRGTRPTRMTHWKPLDLPPTGEKS